MASTAGTATSSMNASMAHIRSSFTLPVIISLFLMGVTIAFLGGNMALVSKLAGSKDDWDSIKTQIGGSIALCFFGSIFFAIALYLFVSQYDLQNMLVPTMINIVLGSTALAVGLSALSVAAITR